MGDIRINKRMKSMKCIYRISIIILFSYVFVTILLSLQACSKERIDNFQSFEACNVGGISIITERDAWNTISNQSYLRSENNYLPEAGDDEEREVNTEEYVIKSSLQPHIWVGNVFTKQSVINGDCFPINVKKRPIRVISTLPESSPGVIESPGHSYFHKYVKEQVRKSHFGQSEEFFYSAEQFTSYDELKVAFGSNINTSSLFNSLQSNNNLEGHKIKKATGLYIKFYQISHKVVMDYVDGLLADVPSSLQDEAIYVNSVAFGRLGILTIETNSTIDVTKETMSRVFHKVFTTGSESLTSEERKFLDSGEYKLFLIAGDSKSSVQCFHGYTEFINHIKNGRFSKKQPGVPIYCTFNHVKDNSPVRIKFRFHLRTNPVYVEFRKRNDGLWLDFYRSRAKIPVIASPKIPFTFTKKRVGNRRDGNSYYLSEYITHKFLEDTTYTVYNAGYGTSIKVHDNLNLDEKSLDDTVIFPPRHNLIIQLYMRMQVRILNNSKIRVLGDDYYGDEKIIFNSPNEITEPFTGKRIITHVDG